MVRLCEPIIWTNLKADVFSLLCCSKTTKRAAYSRETLDSFLNSAMNIEYVYLLLVGISTYFDDKNIDGDKFKIETDKEQTKIIFNTIMLDQPAKWNVHAYESLPTNTSNSTINFVYESVDFDNNTTSS